MVQHESPCTRACTSVLMQSCLSCGEMAGRGKCAVGWGGEGRGVDQVVVKS